MDFTDFLSRLRGRLRRVLLLEGVARLLIALVALVGVVVAVDYGFRLPGWLRLGALLGVLGTIGVLAMRRLQRPLARPMDDATLARLVERREPSLAGRLLSGVEGLPLTAADHAILAGQLTATMPLRLVPAAGLPRQLAMAGATLVAVTIAALWMPGLVMSGLQRLFLPLGSGEWARRSDLTVEMERAVVPADEPLILLVSRPRGGEAAVRVSWTETQRHTSESRLVEGAVGSLARRQALTLTPGQYQITVTSGDAQPLTVTAQVVARPRLDRMQVRLTAPAYLQQPVQELATLACTALPGSRLDFSIHFTFDPGRQVEQCRLTLGGVEVPSERLADGCRGSLTVTSGGELLVSVADQDGIGPRPEPRFTLTVAEDRAPIVRLDGARNNEAISARAVLPLQVEARDDHGLAELRLLAAVSATAEGGGLPAPEAMGERQRFPGVIGLATTRPYSLVVAEVAAVGQRLALLGEARDGNDVTGPGIGRSEPLVLRVVSDDELRQDIDRELVEALERVRQAREELGHGLAAPEKLAPAARGAGLAARKAGDLLTRLARRARDNRLGEELEQPVAEAADAVQARALPALAEAAAQGERGEEPAQVADGALAEAERQLASLRQEGDLARQVAYLLQLQKALSEETRRMVKEFLTRAVDEPAKLRFASLSERQKGLADQVKDVERRLLAASAPALTAAQELVRAEHPADRLYAAAAALARIVERAKAAPDQDAAVTTLTKLLELLRGDAADRALAERAGELAERQEQLVKELERGGDPRRLREAQAKLRAETRDLAEQLERRQGDPEATKNLKDAEESQGQGEQALGQGDASGGAREGGAAAAQLREAQRRLRGEQPEKQEKPEEDPSRKPPDVVRILKELRTLQVKVVSDSQALHRRIGEAELDFAGKRDLEPITELQIEIVLRLRGECMSEVKDQKIVLLALERVAQAMDRVVEHVGRPALGQRGMVLEKIALAELARLLDVVGHMPQGKQGDGGGDGGGGGNQAPFPPAAELALLAAAQSDVARRTASGQPGELAAEQQELLSLVEMLRGGTRPGSRPAILLDRTGRAMASAAYNLAQNDRGLTTRHEQEVAVASLLRILEEAESPSGGGGKSSGAQGKQPQQQRRPAKPAPPGGDPAGDPSGDPPPEGDPSDGEPKQGANRGSNQQGQPHEGGVVVEGEDPSSLHLPPERREQLREALRTRLPPAALEVYRRYLELLEESQP